MLPENSKIPPEAESWEEYAARMEARLAELRRLWRGLGFSAESGELMEYIVTRDQLRALDQVRKHPPKPPYKPKIDSPPLAPECPPC